MLRFVYLICIGVPAGTSTSESLIVCQAAVLPETLAAFPTNPPFSTISKLPPVVVTPGSENIAAVSNSSKPILLQSKLLGYKT